MVYPRRLRLFVPVAFSPSGKAGIAQDRQQGHGPEGRQPAGVGHFVDVRVHCGERRRRERNDFVQRQAAADGACRHGGQIKQRARAPNSFHTVVNVARLVAGPEMRKARAAPGEAPMCMNPAAIGTLAVAQT